MVRVPDEDADAAMEHLEAAVEEYSYGTTVTNDPDDMALVYEGAEGDDVDEQL